MAAYDTVTRGMKRPKAVLFDYGHTIIYETGAFSQAGFEAIMAHCTQNPRGLCAEQVRLLERKWYEETIYPARALGLELSNTAVWRALFESVGLEFDLPLEELEAVFWDAACPPRPMPGMETVFSALAQMGIKSGVVSNLTFCEKTLRERIDRVLPDHPFSFIMTSSAYAVRKPDRRFFDIALARIGCEAKDVWFCGDNTQADVFGAHETGMFPVWFETDIPRAYPVFEEERTIDFAHLHVRTWEAFVQALEKTQP